MKLVKGFVLDVIDKNVGEPGKKPFAVVGIQSIGKDGDGFEVTETVKLMVFGRDYNGGLHNAYRALKGTEVYAPFRAAGDDRGTDVRYFLAGLPVRLQEAPEVTRPAALPAAGQPAKTA